MKLIVGCTESLILTEAATFKSSFDIDCLDASAMYTFVEPTVDRTYCELTSHSIMDVQVDGVAYSGAVFFNSDCNPDLDNPACPDIGIESNLTSYRHVITFYIDTTVIKRTLPHRGPLITIDIDCRSHDHTFLSSWIVGNEIPVQYLQFYGYLFSFPTSSFSCNCPDSIYCQTITYSTVTSSTLPDPVWNSTSQQWDILIHQHEVSQIDFQIKAETNFGVSVTSDLLRIDIIDNCLHDNITLNSTPRVDNEQIEYSSINGFPILKIKEDI